MARLRFGQARGLYSPRGRASHRLGLHGRPDPGAGFSVLGWLLHRDPDTYRYIPASIRRYPGAAAVARVMEARGFVSVRHYRVLGGLMAIHQGWKL